MTTTTSLPSRIAALSEGDTTIISGEAIGAGDITYGLEGVRKLWTAEELQAAASSLVGTKLNPLHSEQNVGEVTRAGWDPATERVVWEAELTDSKLADQVDAGQLEVSIEARHTDGGTDSQTGAMLASDIVFTGLSLVQSGAAPSNSAQSGPAPSEALAAHLSATQIDAALADDAERAEAATTIKPGTIVTWNSQGSRPAGGTVLESIDEGRYDTELAGDAVVNAPAALVRVHRPGTDGWDRTETAVAHKPDTLTTHDAWPDVANAASDYGFEDIPDEYVFDSPDAAAEMADELGLDDVHEHDGDDGAVFMPGEGMGELFNVLEANSELSDGESAAGGEDTNESPGVDATSGHESDADETEPETETESDAVENTDDATSPERGQAEASDTDSTTTTDVETASAADADTGTDDPDADADPTDADPDSDPDSGDADDSDADATTTSDSASTDSNSSTTDATDATDSTTDMTDEPTDPDPETDPDDVSVDELKSELADAREKKSALQEDHEDLEAERDDLKAELEAKAEQIETAKHEYAAALADAGETLLDEEDLVERFELAELADKYDECEEAALADSMPEEDPEPDVQSGGGGSETATLSEAELAEKKELEARRDELEAKDGALAETELERVETELAELTEA